MRNRALFLCGSDPTGGAGSAERGWPTSYHYHCSVIWMAPDGSYRAPSPRSPLLVDDYHWRQVRVTLVGCYAGSVVRAGPEDYPGGIGYEPADRLGLLR